MEEEVKQEEVKQEEVKQEDNVQTALNEEAQPAPKQEVKPDLDHDFHASVARMNELSKGRTEDNIPYSEEYWIARQRHHLAFQRGHYKGQ